ncbi:MAG: type III-B CRISPR module-associated protein Cmr3, partial [Armatimonadetes bacterium]|nr:type III-B CRISPR module-associated protein Cmr3 [Armatimonadota bacterium]
MEWLLRPIDVLFFRGPQPFDAGEWGFVQSLFPPLPSTVQGMVRTALLEAACEDLGRYQQGCVGCSRAPNDCPVRQAVGAPGSPTPASLAIRGPYLVKWLAESAQAGSDPPRRIVRYFPAPYDIRVPSDGGDPFVLDVPEEATMTDIGKVHLPMAPDNKRGQPAAWISENGLKDYLLGNPVHRDDLLWPEDVIVHEQRVGIKQSKDTKHVEEGHLYAIEAVRLRHDPKTGDSYGLGITVTGVPDGILSALPRAVRLGGEGRMVAVEMDQLRQTCSIFGEDFKSQIAQRLAGAGSDGESNIKIVLLQPAKFSSWLPGTNDGRGPDRGYKTWWRKVQVGERAVDIEVVSACMGKPCWIGGWDLARNQPRPLVAAVPAGTVYYCRAQTGSSVVELLHDACLGK